MFFKTKSAEMPHPDNVLSGRSQAIATASNHHITGNPLRGPYPDGLVTAMFGMGCFWGAEKIFWSLPGVFITAVGYAAGGTPNPTYEEVCSGLTGHNEIVFVVFDPKQTSYEALLKVFWEGHNPTQGMRQGNDSGTQYRSGIYTYSDEPKRQAQASRKQYGCELTLAKYDDITTEIIPAPEFYFAEADHQQYLAKNPRDIAASAERA